MLPTRKVRFHSTYENSEIQTGIFGRMERAPSNQASGLTWQTRSLFRRHLCDNHVCVMVKITTKKSWNGTGELLHEGIFWHYTSFTVGGCLGTPKILGTGNTLHLGPIFLHVQNWECHTLKSSAWCQKFGVPCRFFSACKWSFIFSSY